MIEPVFFPSREFGLKALEQFVPKAGHFYASERNTVTEINMPCVVSKLSPYARHRLITEQEIIESVLEHHSLESAEKFIQEVLWRTYWKGWLEMRPTVWTRFLQERDYQRDIFVRDSEISNAEMGKTGIEGFDQWSQELCSTGYLHNHVRIWFASIWIFTLRLPWTLGADFFLRNLLDADPASNTLSWRWVAGLQTPGKTYLATKENICRYTNGRYAPEGLAREAIEIREPPLENIICIPRVSEVDAGKPALLLITCEDMHPESFFPDLSTFKAAVIIVDRKLAFGGKSGRFAASAAANSVARLACSIDGPVNLYEHLDAETLIMAARSAGVNVIVTPYAPVGPVATRLARIALHLADEGYALVQPRREWDSLFWPNATKGFFPFKKRIPSILNALSIR